MSELTSKEQNELESIKSNLGSAHFGFSRNATRRVAKQLLLDGWYFWDGRAIQPKAKHIGAGVYACSAQEFKP